MSLRRLRGMLVNGVVLLVSAFVALILCEFLVRRVAPQDRPLSVALRHLHRPDKDLGYVMVPDFERRVRTPTFEVEVRTNSLGLRDREYSSKHESFRVIGLGDSFVFGIHAGEPENCFLKQLEASISDEMALKSAPSGGQSSRKIEFVNAGVDGYGTEQEVGFLKRLAPTLQPDAVLLAFYLGNDFTDNSGRTRMTVVDGYHMLVASADPYREHSRPLQRRVRLHLHAHSDLYLLFKRRLLHPTRSFFRSETRDAGPAAPKSLDYYIFDAGFANALRQEVSEDLNLGLEATRNAFDDLRAWCDSQQLPVLLCAIPAEQQVDAAVRDQWLKRFGLEAAGLDFALPNRRLAQLAHAAGLPIVDLTEAFAARVARGDDIYLQRDHHWNAAGHALAAELLHEHVIQRLVQAPHIIGNR